MCVWGGGEGKEGRGHGLTMHVDALGVLGGLWSEAQRAGGRHVGDGSAGGLEAVALALLVRLLEQHDRAAERDGRALLRELLGGPRADGAAVHVVVQNVALVLEAVPRHS